MSDQFQYSDLQVSMDYYVDIVICMDGTGSMNPIMDEVKANAKSIYNQFLDKMEELDKEVAQLRIKVITFRDYGEDKEPMTESKFFTFPAEMEAFDAYVNGIRATGGGDRAENALEAIAKAIQSDWTKSGEKRRHVILVFTDDAALPLNARATAPGYPADMPKSLEELGAWWHGTGDGPSHTGSYETRAGRLIVFAPDASPWKDMETWQRYWFAYSQAGAGKGLSDIDIRQVLAVLSGSI